MIFSPLYPHLFLCEDGGVYAHGVKRLTQHAHKGYLRLRYKRRMYYVHRVVASIHCSGYAPGLVVDHINGIKTDNNPNNLQWVSESENHRLAWASGLLDNRDIAGESHGRARLTEANIMCIRTRYAAGEFQRVIASDFNITTANVSLIVRGLNWKHLPLITARRPVRPGWMSPEILSSALALADGGMSINAAARELGIKPSTLHYAVRAHRANVNQISLEDVNNAMKELA